MISFEALGLLIATCGLVYAVFLFVMKSIELHRRMAIINKRRQELVDEFQKRVAEQLEDM